MNLEKEKSLREGAVFLVEETMPFVVDGLISINPYAVIFTDIKMALFSGRLNDGLIPSQAG